MLDASDADTLIGWGSIAWGSASGQAHAHGMLSAGRLVSRRISWACRDRVSGRILRYRQYWAVVVKWRLGGL
jgi:hypothetical protein